jgi:phage tail-like protein
MQMSLKTSWQASIIVALLVLIGVVTVAPIRTDRVGYRSGSHSVKLVIDGVDVGPITVVDGLSIEQEVIAFRSGSEPGIVLKVPGEVSYGNLTLKRGLTRGDLLWEWMQTSFDPGGDVMRKNGSIIVYDHRGRETARYNFFRAWPAKWTGPTLDASGNDVAIEEIVLAVEAWEEG